MVKISRLLAYIFFFILALVYFMPKESVYYYLEKKLLQEKVILSGEDINDNGFSLELKNSSVSYDSIQSANIEDINLKIFGIYNSLSIQNIELSGIVSSFTPLIIDTIDVSYTIFNPLNIVATASGEFGEASANISILDKNISVLLIPSDLMFKKYKSTLRNLKKNQNGEYEYDKTF